MEGVEGEEGVVHEKGNGGGKVGRNRKTRSFQKNFKYQDRSIIDSSVRAVSLSPLWQTRLPPPYPWISRALPWETTAHLPGIPESQPIITVRNMPEYVSVDRGRTVEIPEPIAEEVREKGGFETIISGIPGDEISAITEQITAIGNEKRLKILCALSLQRMCVCMLAFITESSYSQCSYHLSLLKRKGLIAAESLGSHLIYSITPPGRHLLECFIHPEREGGEEVEGEEVEGEEVEPERFGSACGDQAPGGTSSGICAAGERQHENTT